MKKKLLRYISTTIMISFLIGCGSEKENIKDLRVLQTNSIYKLHINEVLSANANTNYDPDFKQFSDWIELYNDSNESKKIDGYYLSDSKKNIRKWEFPKETIITPYSYLIIWADGKDTKQKALHTNFKLSQKGERVILSDQNGITIDKLKYSAQEGDISCAKIDDEIIYMNPTPNTINENHKNILKRSKIPRFSKKSGFYNDEQVVELKSNGEIYYTLDGSHPTTSSLYYNSPIIIDKNTVIRAISVEDGKFESHSFSQTYLIDEDISLSVMSLSIDDKYLRDDEIGIYKNFNEEWMRAGNIEFIKDGESKFSQNVGVKLHGASSRAYPQKSLTLYSKSKFGNSTINYSLFQDKPNIKVVKSFILRNSGSDWHSTMIRDALSHCIAKEISNIDYQSYEPTIAFINGKYYGILNLREKVDNNYIEANHYINKQNINLLKKEEAIALKGTNQDYKKLIGYIQSNSISNLEKYNYITEQIDIDEFTNYNILEQYIGNVDWPQNNMKYWKAKKRNSQWRWILYDTDMGFSLKIKNVPLYGDYTTNTIDRLNHAILDFNSEVILYRRLLTNKSYSNKFILKYNRLLDTVFLPKNINKKITTLKNHIEPEIARHLKKWFGETRDINDWEDDINELYDYSNRRNEIVKEQLKEFASEL